MMQEECFEAGLQGVIIDSAGSVEFFALSFGGEERISVVEGSNDGEIFTVSMPPLGQLSVELGCEVTQEEVLNGIRNAVEGIPVPLLFNITWAEALEPTTISTQRDASNQG